MEAIKRDGGGLEHLFKAAPGEQQQPSTPPMYHAMMNSGCRSSVLLMVSPWGRVSK
ncbi:MAG: hypothetical protein ACPGZU_13130 [Ketobacter sp.]|uniref:hypothetical protein n=1 Tax=unclassified Ketobacter TaxID=2639109 RepID=UPI0025C2EF43|nr:MULTISPECIES: hypothetical protein [unclassified Ketobacter]MEC8811674.1 hypothetical protein [Pseudomonadota bacterium]